MAGKNRKGKKAAKAGVESKDRTADIETASEYATISDLKKKAGMDEEDRTV